jgi:6,7-dimethyl-8-ribityllumazine synthase
MRPARSRKIAAPVSGVRSAALLVSRYHEEITGRLREGAERVLRKAGVARIDAFEIPGAYELSQAAQAAAETGRYQAVIALGCILRGETRHCDYLARAVANGLDQVGRLTGVAVAFGVLTVDNPEQASARAGGPLGNKGEEAAKAALELASFLKRIRNGKQTKSA